MHGVAKGGLTPSEIDRVHARLFLCPSRGPSIYSNRTVDVLETTDDGLGLWLGEAVGLYSQKCSTSLKSKNLAIKRAGLLVLRRCSLVSRARPLFPVLFCGS